MLAQIEGFESATNGLGWFFWTGKTEGHCAPEWDLTFLLDNDIAPKNFCSLSARVCPN